MSAKIVKILKDQPFDSNVLSLENGFLSSMSSGKFDVSDLRVSSAILRCEFLLKAPVISSSSLSEGDSVSFPDVYDLDFFYIDTVTALVAMQFNPSVFQEVKKLSKQFNFPLVR